MQVDSVFSFSSIEEASREIEKIGVNPVGTKVMALKAVFKAVLIKGVDPKTANIVKQEMLSRGGDVAVSRTVGRFDATLTDILIMGTLAQHIRLLRKLDFQTFGDCRKIAGLLREALFKGYEINSAPVW